MGAYTIILGTLDPRGKACRSWSPVKAFRASFERDGIREPLDLGVGFLSVSCQVGEFKPRVLSQGLSL